MTTLPAESTWLDPDIAKAVLGSSLGDVLEAEPFGYACDAVREWVEGHRDDLWTVATETVPSEFVPTGTVLYGSALLAHRWYSRRRAPLGDADDVVGDILRDDPDLSRMLGIGQSGRVVFGAPAVTT